VEKRVEKRAEKCVEKLEKCVYMCAISRLLWQHKITKDKVELQRNRSNVVAKCTLNVTKYLPAETKF